METVDQLNRSAPGRLAEVMQYQGRQAGHRPSDRIDRSKTQNSGTAKRTFWNKFNSFCSGMELGGSSASLFNGSPAGAIHADMSSYNSDVCPH
jgi:hypothetical protein